MPSALIHSLQNTFFSFNNHAEHVSVWTRPHSPSERPADVTLSLKVRHQNTNFSLDCHTPKHRQPSCALGHSFTEEPLSQSCFCNCTAGSQIPQQSHRESTPLPVNHLQCNRSLSISSVIAPTSHKNVTKPQRETLWPSRIHIYADIHNGRKVVSPKRCTEGPRVSLPPISRHEHVLHT